MSKEKPQAFAFDRSKDQVVATRAFDHGVIRGVAGEPLPAAALADLSDAAVRHLVEVAGVAEIKTGKAAKSAASDDDKTPPAGGAGSTDKGAAKP